MNWEEASEWECNWWGDCGNTFNEESRQYIYARFMGLDEYATNWYGNKGWDFGKMRIIDIGGGPASMLLKSKAARRVVIDPCRFPNWVSQRYSECGIEFWNLKAEDRMPQKEFDLTLIYNVLQHVDDPTIVLEQAKATAREIRIFDWLETPISDGHIHSLKAEQLDQILSGSGKVHHIKEGGLVGKAYTGIFPC